MAADDLGVEGDGREKDGNGVLGVDALEANGEDNGNFPVDSLNLKTVSLM